LLSECGGISVLRSSNMYLVIDLHKSFLFWALYYAYKLANHLRKPIFGFFLHQKIYAVIILLVLCFCNESFDHY
jgi:hypothetical protein